MDYTNDEIEEIRKILKTMKQLEGILRTSSNTEQRKRVSKDLHEYKARLDALCPSGVPQDIANENKKPQEASQPEQETADDNNSFKTVEQFEVTNASPHSTDGEVNFLASMLTAFEREFWPIMSDQHIKMDFSHSAERDSFFHLLEEAKRNLKILLETIEDHANATNSDFREQLQKMKNKQTRIFLYDTVKFFKKFKQFSAKLREDLATGGNIIMNKDEKINFRKEFQTGSFLQDYTVIDAVETAFNFVSETIRALNLPELDG